MRHSSKRIGCMILALLLTLFCGCGLIGGFQERIEAGQEEMDAMLAAFMTCVENRDAQGAAALSYDPQHSLSAYSGIIDNWPAHATDEFELVSIHMTVDNETGGPRTVTDAVYIVHGQDEDYQVEFSTCKDSRGSGITRFYVVKVQELIDSGIEPASPKSPAAKKTFGQWCFFAFWMLMLAFVLFTILDIARKKPRLYALWIVCALIFFGGHFSIGSGGVQTGIKIGLLNASKWVRYNGGVNVYQICLPLGAIIYWLRRRELLKRAAPANNYVPGEQSPVPPQDPEP